MKLAKFFPYTEQLLSIYINKKWTVLGKMEIGNLNLALKFDLIDKYFSIANGARSMLSQSRSYVTS